MSAEFPSNLTRQARALGLPEDYFHGLDWGGELLPREIVSFCRVAQDHRTSGWDGISAKAGRYDQHDRYVLLVALEGRGRMGIETTVREIGESEAHLLFPHQVHYYIELPEEFSWLYITFELPPETRPLLEEWRTGGRELTPQSEELLEKFLEAYEEGDGLGASLALGKAFPELEKGPLVMAASGEETDLIARVKKYVMGNLESDLAMPALSSAMGISESYLRAVFREEAGVSLGNFVRSVRLVRATYLLEEGELELGEIAEQTGFGSLTSFTRAFRRMYEMTPSSYRKQAQTETRSKVEIKTRTHRLTKS